MHALCMQDRIPGFRFFDDAIALFDRQRFVDLVLQSQDLLTLIVIADPAFEGRVGAGGIVSQFVAELIRLCRERITAASVAVEAIVEEMDSGVDDNG